MIADFGVEGISGDHQMALKRAARGLPGIVLMALLGGCGGADDRVKSVPPYSAPSATARRLVFVGFDASPPLVGALRLGKLQGLVIQNPYKMGEIGVKTLVEHLEKKEVPAKVSTGETLVTPENMEEPAIAASLDPPQAENRAEAGSTGDRKKWRVMVIPKGTTHVFWKTIHAGAVKAAQELGNVEVIWQGPQKEDERSQQIQLVQNAIASGVDGIVLAPLDSKALVKPVEEAVAKGIPVVIIDSGLESAKIVSYVATDNYNGGILAARRLGELLKGQGKIVLLRYAIGSASTEEREKGFTDTIAGDFPGIAFLSDTEYAGATSDTAQQKGQNLVTRFRGQIDGIFCPNESSTVGMLRALEGAGLLAGRP
jgi:ribose transport system substrate-binding protein